MPSFCGIINCTNKAQRVKKSFYRLPAVLSRGNPFTIRLSSLRKKKWLLAIKRKDISESTEKHLRVCQDHFVTGKPAAMEDIHHPDWVPSIRLGYGNTHDGLYIQSLRQKVLKHVNPFLGFNPSFTYQVLVNHSTSGIADDMDSQDKDSIDRTTDDNHDTDEIGDNTSGSQKIDDDILSMMCSLDKNDVDNIVPEDTVDDMNDSHEQEDIDDKVPDDCVGDLSDCNMSSSFLTSLTKFRQTASVSVQTELTNSDLNILHEYCEVTRKKLKEANNKIKLLNRLLNSKCSHSRNDE